MLKAIRIVNRVCKVCNFFGVCWIVILALLTITDVVLRFFFNAPFPGTLEYSEMILVVIVWMGFAYTDVVKGHISVELMVSRLSARKQIYFDILASLAGLIVMAILIWISAKLALYSWNLKELSEVVNFPVYPFKMVLCAGAVLFWFELLGQLYINIFRLSGKAVAGGEV